MKQGIVMEIKNREAIVLTQDGAFERVSLKKDEHIEVGSEIAIPVARQSYVSRRGQKIAISIVAVAAALFLLLFNQSLFFKHSQLAVAAYVSVDINPSIELGITERLKVVEVIPVNEDGKKLVKQIGEHYQDQSLLEFIDYTVELAKKEGYLNDNNKDVLLSTTMVSKDVTAPVEKNLTEIKKEIESEGVTVKTLTADQSSREKAKSLGVSTGKYLIYEEAKENITIAETKDLSVTELYEKVEKNKNKDKNSKANNKNKAEKLKKESKKIEENANKQNQSKNEDKANGKINNGGKSRPSSQPPDHTTNKNDTKSNNNNNNKNNNKSKNENGPVIEKEKQKKPDNAKEKDKNKTEKNKNQNKGNDKGQNNNNNSKNSKNNGNNNGN